MIVALTCYAAARLQIGAEIVHLYLLQQQNDSCSPGVWGWEVVLYQETYTVEFRVRFDLYRSVDLRCGEILGRMRSCEQIFKDIGTKPICSLTVRRMSGGIEIFLPKGRLVSDVVSDFSYHASKGFSWQLGLAIAAVVMLVAILLGFFIDSIQPEVKRGKSVFKYGMRSRYAADLQDGETLRDAIFYSSRYYTPLYRGSRVIIGLDATQKTTTSAQHEVEAYLIGRGLSVATKKPIVDVL